MEPNDKTDVFLVNVLMCKVICLNHKNDKSWESTATKIDKKGSFKIIAIIAIIAR